MEESFGRAKGATLTTNIFPVVAAFSIEIWAQEMNRRALRLDL
jgi:hypothetical protein